MPPTDALQGELQAVLGDRYELRGEIGRGGMATVFLAYDSRFERDVAIKVLHADLAAVVGTERFRREIQIAARLTHPHILPVHDSGGAGRFLFYVMPYVHGQSLRALIDRQRQLPIEEAVRIACEVAGALDFAHRQGFVHRDIKPENILIEDGQVLLADFGIARAITDATGDEPLTQSGVTLGTANYMSPEQAAAERSLDGRSDIYSLACVLYEMIAGQPPFVAATLNAVLARHALEAPPPLSVVRQTVPAAVEDVVDRALSKAPADRFATAAEFADALLQAALSAPSSTGRITSSNTLRVHRTMQRKRRRRRIVVAAIGGIALIAIAATSTRHYLTAKSAASAADVTQAKHIAVLYFEDLSQGSLGFLADGLTESIVEALRRTRDLTVISTNGVLPFKGKSIVADSIGRLLGVGTLVRGSIERSSAGALRVIVRLVDAQSGVDLDRASIEGPEAEIIKLRDSVAFDVTRSLRRRLGEEIQLREAKAGTSNPTAWILEQRAERARKDADALVRTGDAKQGGERMRSADSLFAAAEALDASWLEPSVKRANLAFARARVEREPLLAAAWIDSGLAHADRALARDRNSTDALESRGALEYLRWLRHLARTPAEQSTLLSRAEADLRQAVTINPGQANAWNLLSHLYTQKPDVVEAKIAATRAYEEDAYLAAAPDVLWRLYTISYDLEHFADAVKWCAEGRRRFADNPRFVECRLWLMTAKPTNPNPAVAWALVDSLKRMTEADEWAARRPVAEMLAAAALANTGQPDSARRVLDRAHPDPRMDPEGEIISQEAFVRTLAGDRDGAFRLIKQYLALKPEHRQGLAQSQSWWWRDLRTDPRFRELIGASR